MTQANSGKEENSSRKGNSRKSNGHEARRYTGVVESNSMPKKSDAQS